MRAVRPAIIALACCFALAAHASAQGIPAEQLKKIKAATVFVKVAAQQGGGSGSGFLVRADGTTGYVVTNDHVVTMKWKFNMPGKPRAAVAVVFNSGEPDEWTASGEIAAGDIERDLAVIRFRTNKKLPEPLSLNGPNKVPETTQVYIAGFPFGEALASGDKNPEITINPLSVSSNRTDDRGLFTDVQLAGSMNPGNSGGPVITADGKLVGVAAAGIRGSGIGMAIPHYMVSEMFKGRVTDPMVIIPRELAASRQGIMLLKVVDPMGKVRAARAVMAPARPVKETKPSADVAKLPGALPIPVTSLPDGPAFGVAKVTFPANASHVWVQSEWTEADKSVHRGPATKLSLAELAGDRSGQNVPPGFTPPTNIPAAPPSGPSPFDGPFDGGGSAAAPPAAGSPGFETPSAPAAPAPSQYATSLPPTPAGQVALTALNLGAQSRLGQPVVVDVMTSGVDLKGNGDGPSLYAYLPTGRQTGLLDFVVDEGMARAINAAGLTPPNGPRVAARVRGTVKEAPVAKGWKLVVVDEVSLLAPTGAPAVTFSRGGAPANPAPGGGPAEWDRTLIALVQSGRAAVGREVELRVVVSGLAQELTGENGRTRPIYRLQFTNTSRLPVVGLNLFLPDGLVDRFRAAQKQAGGPVNAAVTVRVTGYSQLTQEVTGQVDGVRTYDPQWQSVVWASSATAPAGTPPSTGSPAPEFASSPPTPRPTSAPAETKDTAGGGMSPLIIAIVGVALLLLLVGGAGLGWLLLAKGKKSSKKGRFDDEDDDDYDDEDDDDRPRRGARRGRR